MNLTPVEARMLEILGASGKAFSLANATDIFADMLALKGATFVSIIAVTEPKMRKTGNPFHGVAVKVASVNGQVNFDYAGAVERARVKEGEAPEFEQGTSWHEPYMRDGRLTPFCKHKSKDEYYLRIRRLSGSSIIINRNTGVEIPKDEIEPFLQVSSRTNQGLDKPVEFLTYGLNTIKAVTCAGQTRIVR